MERRGFLTAAPALVAAAAMPMPGLPLPTFETHLAGMLESLGEMPWPDNSRWFLAAAGRSGRVGRLLELSRYDTVPDPEIPQLMIERRTVLVEA